MVPPDTTGTATSSAPLRAGLEVLRKRLLDLTLRNKLLNFRHQTKTCLRVIDELPDELFRRLREGEEITFRPVRESERRDEDQHLRTESASDISKDQAQLKLGSDLPVVMEVEKGTSESLEKRAPRSSRRPAKEEAERQGLNTSFDLPISGGDDQDRHYDKYVQTLHYADELEAILRRIGSRARTALEESGTNMLYLIFGFLEWYESPDSEKQVLAPLMVLPVILKKNKPSRALGGMYAYSVEYSGEDLLTNLSLGEKLSRDFGLALPSIEDDDTPERYWARVGNVIDQMPRWRIRRQVTLGLLHFGKLLMFLDLDPDRHPHLLTHERTGELVGTMGRDEDTGDLADVPDLDSPSVTSEIQHTIYEADSTQHSAIIDVLKGRNLVIEGPPGTGKSQTITNIIAAALGRGKSVLFVSEKLAALEVVRDRLDRAGLGHFCLELHSHRTRKDKFHADLRQRLMMQGEFQQPSEFQEKLRQLEQHKADLVEYARLIRQTPGLLGATLFDIIWSREDLIRNHPWIEDLSGVLLLPHADEVDRNARDSAHISVDVYGQQVAVLIQKYGSPLKHPWAGVENGNLTFVQERELRAKGQVLITSIESLQRHLQSLRLLLSAPVSDSIAECERLVQMGSQLPPPNGSELYALLPLLVDRQVCESAMDFLEELHRLKQMRQELMPSFDRVPCVSQEQAAAFSTDSGRLVQSGMGDMDGVALKATLDVLTDLHELLVAAQQVHRVFAEVLGQSSDGNIEDLVLHHEFLNILKECPWERLALRNQAIRDTKYREVRRRAGAEAEKIRRLRDRLEEEFNLSEVRDAEELERHIHAATSASWLSRLVRADYRAVKQFYQGLLKEAGQGDHALMVVHLQEVYEYQERLEEYCRRDELAAAFGEAFQGIDTPFADILALETWFDLIAERFAPHMPRAAAHVEALWENGIEQLKGIADQVDLDSRVWDLVNSSTAEPSMKERFGALDAMRFRRQSFSTLIEDISSMAEAVREALSQLKALGFRPDIQLKVALDCLTRLVTLQEGEERLETHAFMGQIQPEVRRTILDTPEALRDTILLAKQLAAATIPPIVLRWLLNADYPNRVIALKERLSKLRGDWSAFTGAWGSFSSLGGLTREWLWGQSPDEAADGDLGRAKERLRVAIDASNTLGNWLEFVRAKHALRDAKLNLLVGLVEEGRLPPSGLRVGYDFALYNGLVDQAFKGHTALQRFSRLRHEAIRKRYAELDREVMVVYRKQLAHQIAQREIPPGVKTGPRKDYTDKALLENEVARQRGHLPLRTLIRRAHKALLALKPCFMMGPMSVAQYLAPGHFHFDLVVMDEASQLKPEDAIGAVSRASQVVVVGDSKQLPPTTFFDTVIDEADNPEEEDLSTAIVDSESILDRASVVYQPKRQLQWHYRSRHQDLIAFSNHEFYNHNLILFPTSSASDPRLGVKYHPIDNGLYKKGVNRPEAEAIVEHVLAHMMSSPDESLGVVAFNSEQSQLIEELFDTRSKNDPAAQIYLSRWEETKEPFFIKNLETVQGDERDCIFVSFTYGPDESRHVYQRFGPVTGQHGHRRLNVLFTRAKYRTEIFTSMGPDDVVVDSTSSWGVRAMRDYLRFAKTGILAQTTGNKSPEPNFFELSVGAALKELGWNVEHQIGEAGFFIDLGIRHPQRPGCFVIGIECDGATYHSAKSARDRDRLRESILRDRGWNLVRVWSTDWFRNRHNEIERLHSRIQDALRAAGE